MVLLVVVGLTIVVVVLVRWIVARRRQKHVMRAGRLRDLVGTTTARQRLVSRASDQQLCELWDRSGREIASVRLASSLEWYANLRRDILNELSARNPTAVELWLAEHPDSDPGPYLRRVR